ncbi:MAG: hypothetical protein Q7S22_04890 [Candidatus Micrarchaeota archaeon]|nr:hypothetical protein [Candidatus Micrarchaeota archaeon]
MVSPKIKVLTQTDLARSPRDIRAILPTPLISKVRPLCGVHATTAAEVRRLLVANAFTEGIDYVPPPYMHSESTNTGFFLYLLSGRLFDFESRWDERIKVNDIRRHVNTTLKTIFHYTPGSLEKAAGAGQSSDGLGMVLLELERSHLELLKDDPDYAEQMHEPNHSRMHSKYIPKELFRSFGCRVLGAVVTDEITNLTLAKALIEDREGTYWPVHRFGQGLDYDKVNAAFLEASVRLLVK